MADRLSYVAKVEPVEEGGYVASFPDVPSALTQGDNLRETKSNAREALILALSYIREQEQEFPESRYRLRNDLRMVKQFRVSLRLTELVQ